MLSLQVSLAIAFLILSDVVATHQPFNPREYPKKVVSCPAINRAENIQVDIQLRMNTSLFLLPVPRHMRGATLIRIYYSPQTTSTSTPRPKRRCFSCTAGRVYGPAGNIRYKSLRLRSVYCRSRTTSELISPSFRMITASSHQTFVGSGPRPTQVTSNHLAPCPTSLATSCAFSNTLVLQKQSPWGT